MIPHLPVDGLFGRDQAPFYPGEALVEAARVAIALEIPLLLTGEPGCGKTDFAFAVARHLSGLGAEWTPDHEDTGLLEGYIRSDTTAQDLLYQYDAVRRFADAHHGSDAERFEARDARRYVDLRPLGVALASRTRRVVLLDEIDKAHRDLPNDLLRELDQGRFDIKEIPLDAETRFPAEKPLPKRTQGWRRADPEAPPKPIIIVTSNEERQLPNAFLRRCAFHHIEFPKAEALARILRGHAPDVGEAEADTLVQTFLKMREIRGLTKKPGTSELIAWARALTGDGLSEADYARALAFVPGDSPWKTLPGQMCLIKLREDRLRLQRA